MPNDNNLFKGIVTFAVCLSLIAFAYILGFK